MHRLKRYFVHRTPEGETRVTTTPTADNLIPDYLKKALRPGEVPPPQSDDHYDDAASDTGSATPLKVSTHIPYVYTDTQDERVKLRLERRSPCGLCSMSFDLSALPFSISRKGILEQRTKWGIHELKEMELIPSAMYERMKVCVFCGQFFGLTRDFETDQEAIFDQGPYLRKNVKARVQKYRREYFESLRRSREDAEGEKTLALTRPPPAPTASHHAMISDGRELTLSVTGGDQQHCNLAPETSAEPPKDRDDQHHKESPLTPEPNPSPAKVTKKRGNQEKLARAPPSATKSPDRAAAAVCGRTDEFLTRVQTDEALRKENRMLQLLYEEMRRRPQSVNSNRAKSSATRDYDREATRGNNSSTSSFAQSSSASEPPLQLPPPNLTSVLRSVESRMKRFSEEVFQAHELREKNKPAIPPAAFRLLNAHLHSALLPKQNTSTRRH
jgi:hypothetical protein